MAKKITGEQMKEFWRQVSEGHIGWEYFQKFLDHGMEAAGGAAPYLRRISGDPLAIGPCGRELLADATGVFKGRIDPDFESWNANEPGQETGETKVEVHEMVKDGTFADLFGSLPGNINDLCLTQAQIISFVQNYRGWLRTEGYGTFFLFRSYGQLFVADVNANSDGALRVFVHRFGDSCGWIAEDRHFVVVPQL